MSESENRVFKLLKDPNFVQWIQNPTEESQHFWTKWLANHPEARREVQAARRIIGSAKLERDVPISLPAYDQMLENIVAYSSNKKQSEGRFQKYWRPMAAAASVAIAILGFAFFQNKQVATVRENEVRLNWKEKEVPYGRKMTTRLPDKSVVTLNAGSRIAFPEVFADSIREIRLSGEAFFQVERDPDRPFVVKINGNHVKVLGTSFNVRAYPEEHQVEVAVASGLVAYSTISGNQVILEADEMAIHDSQGLITGHVNKMEAFGWKDKILYFNKSSFNQVKAELQKWYGIEIISDGDFSVHGTFSEQFNNPSLKEVLNGLSFLYRFKYEIDGDQVTLTQNTLPMN